MPAYFHIKKRPFGSNARIHHDHMERFMGKIRNGRRQEKRGMSKILGRNLVAQVENSSRGIDAQDDTFHSRHIGGFFAKIGGESDNGLRHGLMLATAGTGLMEF